jgi:hypothetical protein
MLLGAEEEGGGTKKGRAWRRRGRGGERDECGEEKRVGE